MRVASPLIVRGLPSRGKTLAGHLVVDLPHLIGELHTDAGDVSFDPGVGGKIGLHLSDTIAHLLG